MTLANKSVRRLRRILLVLVLMGAIGTSVYFMVRSVRADLLYHAAERSLEAHDLATAHADLLSCLELRPNKPEVHFLLARTARQAGDYQAASAHLDDCARLGGMTQAVELERNLSAVQRGNIPAALDRLLWAYVEKGHPDAVPILEALSKGYLQTFRLREALLALNQWLERRPQDVPALLLRGDVQVLLAQGSATLALPDFRRAAELAPEDLHVREKLAQALLQALLPAEALEHFDWLNARKPDDTTILFGRARCYRALGKTEQARRLLDDLLRRSPQDVDALVERGKVELDAGAPDLAETWFRKAARQAPYSREAVHNLVLCLTQLKKTRDLNHWQRRLESIQSDLKRLGEISGKIIQTPSDAGLRCEAGKIFLKAGNDKEGLRWLASALHEDPAHAESRRVLREYYQKKEAGHAPATHP